MKQTSALPALDLLSSGKPRIKYGTAKQFVTRSSSQPEALLPHLPFFVELMNSENSILRWSAIDIVGNIATVTEDTQTEKFIKQFTALLRCGKLITAAHAISALEAIATAQPKYQKRILDNVLKVEYYTYETQECLNIITGKALLVLNRFIDDVSTSKKVIAFIERQSFNTRPATRKKAELLTRKLHRITKKR